MRVHGMRMVCFDGALLCWKLFHIHGHGLSDINLSTLRFSCLLIMFYAQCLALIWHISTGSPFLVPALE